MKKSANIKRDLFVIITGNILIWYDFAVYAYLADVISQVFFPSKSISIGLVKTFTIFALGFLIRPLGGLLFGHIGDKHGRKIALQICMYMMAIPSILTGCLPTYKQIGILAPILLLALRLIQGVAAGGGVIGSSTYLFEKAPPNRRNFWTSWASFSSLAGVLTGSLLVTLMYHMLSGSMILMWGWRVAFLLGLGPIVLAVIVHFQLTETSMFTKISANKTTYKSPAIEGICGSWARIIQIIAMNIFISVSLYVLFVWMPIYARSFLSYSALSATLVNTLAMLVLIILTPISGLIADKYISYKTMSLISVISICILSYPLFLGIIYGGIIFLFVAQIIFAIAASASQGVILATINRLFPTRVRFSCSAIGFNIANAFFAGTAPLACTYLIHKTSSLTIPAIYVTISGLIALPAFLSLKSGGYHSETL